MLRIRSYLSRSQLSLIVRYLHTAGYATAMPERDQIPDVQGVAVLPSEQQLRIDAAAHHARRSPLAGDHDVVAEMPPEIVGEILRAPIQLPAPARLESLMVEDEDATGAVAILSA